jgi:hypothetical protein
MPLSLVGAKSTADLICDYLDGREDLEINCTMLDKVVLVTCEGAGGLKKNFHDEEDIVKMSAKLKPQNKDSQKSFAQRQVAAAPICRTKIRPFPAKTGRGRVTERTCSRKLLWPLPQTRRR